MKRFLSYNSKTKWLKQLCRQEMLPSLFTRNTHMLVSVTLQFVGTWKCLWHADPSNEHTFACRHWQFGHESLFSPGLCKRTSRGSGNSQRHGSSLATVVAAGNCPGRSGGCIASFSNDSCWSFQQAVYLKCHYERHMLASVTLQDLCADSVCSNPDNSNEHTFAYRHWQLGHESLWLHVGRIR